MSRVGGPVPDHVAVELCARLRHEGVEVPVSSTVTFVEALGAIRPLRPDGLYWSGRVTLLRRPEDLPLYDRAFAAVFLGGADRGEVTAEDEPDPGRAASGDDPSPGADDGSSTAPDGGWLLRWSREETLRDRDFATCSEAELAEVWALARSLQPRPATRPGRRYRAVGALEGRLDLRRSVAGALRTDGEVLRRRHRRRSPRPRRLVLLLDVSGSMSVYARALVRFGHLAVGTRRGCEVFAFGTRLTRLTHQLRTVDADLALRRVAEEVPDWSGGTRLGETMGAFLDLWGQRGMARGSVVVVLSDGWDRGDPARLGTEMARLSRLAHRVVWVNPLKASPGYAPLARGMAAALPYCDDFVEGHSLSSLEALARIIDRAAEVDTS